MKPLTIELAKGERRGFQSIGWKAPKEGDYRRQFFALDPNGKPQVVTLNPAMPVYYDPSRRAKAVLTCEPFPEAVCVGISPCRLLPPPCYQSREELNGQLPGHRLFEPWRAVYLETHDEFLLLEPSDDGPLQERLNEWLAAMRAAYEHEAKAWRERIERVKTATLQELDLGTEEQRAMRLGEFGAQLDMVESENPIDGVPCKGRLKLTLADVKLGFEGIRDAWMHEYWAKKNGEDLRVMSRERCSHRRWLEMHTGTHATVFDSTTRERLQGIEPPRFGKDHDVNPRFLEACAMVRFRARFADNANTTVYLTDCETRDELDAVELDELAKLRGDPGIAKAISQTVSAALIEPMERLATERQRLEAMPGQIAAENQRLEAKTQALGEIIAPLNRLYSEVELADIRRRAIGQAVPDLFADWVLSQFQASNPPRLPTKGDAFNACGPGTLNGKKLEQAGFGISKQRFADHLTVMRRVLEQKGWLAPRVAGKSRKRESSFQPDERLEDFNQPNPAESAEDRDDERQAAGLNNEDRGAAGDSSKQSDAD